ncbi:hypothetical protein HGM15179_010700 [Zosterops borbonicus]|uniref:Envelope glycoprotein n=1 Tax=Zosterops borbonicus TaxID=364589 RepID=A0A8K1GE96_9PASS|nr:hypothetical protein HGM15179_010700 [Zosterops borbonicus]
MSRTAPTIARRGSPRIACVIRVILLASLAARVWTWMVPQPKANVWKTLARSLGQDHICLSSAAAGDPLSSCLVGIPFAESEYPPQLLRIKASYNRKPIPMAHFKEINHDSHLVKNPLAFWKEWVYHLPAVSQEPQELDLLGSSPAPFCIQFTFHPSEGQRKLYHTIRQVHNAYWASLCCFNLTSKAEDIQRSIVQIRDMVGTIKKETGGWLDNIFDKMGISSWSGSIVQTCITIIFILFIVAIAFALIKRLLLKIISDNTSPSVNHLESGASVDVELEELESALRQLEEHRLAAQDEETAL